MDPGGGAMMFVFDWSEFATDAVVARLYFELGMAPVTEEASAARARLAALFGLVGGLRISDELPTDADRDSRALQLVDEACGHTLRHVAAPDITAGFVVDDQPANVAFEREVQARDVVAINNATAAQLNGLPGIGPALAARIVASRGVAGPFSSAEELDQRVEGLGPIGVEDLTHVVSYARPELLAIHQADDLGSRLRLVHALGGSGATSLLGTLDVLIASCAEHPHPFTTHRVRRRPPTPPSDEALAAEWVAVLANDAYHPAVESAIGDALVSIEVCMFHIALGGAEHPTRILLEKLVEAHQRGVAVRVVLDRDRKNDPYLSTIINKPAKEFLENAGVPVRSDAEETLMHSKFLVIDRKLAVIGSHNWSAGSYEDFDDISLAISSSDLASELLLRFDELWDAA
ncbi:phospholipase D-like domain-containing protein [Mycetocola sp. 2940]|uniref:phospholipase D-like domain-containing protein n=1 Tax=Mycetocola sp. 2940 TaxID=3156452 RepID=UPI0033939A4C